MKIFRSMVMVWALFASASLLTFCAYKTLWDTEWYRVFLSFLGILSGGLGVILLRQTGLKLLPLAGVAIGLLVGQWWLVQALVLQLSWRIGGFAP